MSLHSIDRQSDPRVTCGLLAKEIIKDLDSAPSEEDDRKVLISNFIRLLEMYRYDRFVDRKPRGVLMRNVNGKLQHKQKQPLLDIKQALEQAKLEVYGEDVAQEEVAIRLIKILRSLRDNKLEEVDNNELQQARRFFLVLHGKVTN